ncbi:MAG TPA: phosphotransferase [Candidatus Eisenbacteria bacterium]|nr:phosphotransferase [Candidatus Eisenbacteria bacterium]
MSPEAIAGIVFRTVRGECDAGRSTVYMAVPGNESARWLLPAGGSGIDGVLASWKPYRLRSRAAWAAIRAASRVGRVAALPGVATLEVEEAGGTDWSKLGWPGQDQPVPVIYLGTPGPRRKAVVHLVDRDSGSCRAVAKVPLTDEAKDAVLHEAEVLQALAAECLEAAPRLLFVDRARGIATQSFVEGPSGGRRPGPEVWRLLRSFVLPGERTSLKVQVKRWAQEMRYAPGDRTIAAALDDLRDDTSLPLCWEHGDCTPWNIKRRPDGRYALIDWEEARRNGVPLQDAYHFLHMQDFLFSRSPRLHAAEVMAEAAGMGLTLRLCRKLETAYLVSAYVKCMQRGNPERARFVLHALTLCRSQAS